jgi:hypothetical protein
MCFNKNIEVEVHRFAVVVASLLSTKANLVILGFIKIINQKLAINPLYYPLDPHSAMTFGKIEILNRIFNILW